MNISHQPRINNGRFRGNTLEFNNRRPIHIACENGNVEILQLLIENKCVINACDRDNNCPIHIACEKGFVEILKLLIDNHCNLEACNKRNQRPIHVACENGHVGIVETLINSNCDIYAIDKFNQSPLEIAFNNKHQKIMKILLDEVEKSIMPDSQSASNSTSSNCEIGISNQEERFSGILQQYLILKNLNSQSPHVVSETETNSFPLSSELMIDQNDEFLPPDIESNYDCKICFQNKISIALDCGHTLCDQCVGNLSTCHICRRIITDYTYIYL